MAGIGTFIMLGIVVGSICVSMYLFLDSQTVTITGEPGNQITVGNVEFDIAHVGNYASLEKTEEYKNLQKRKRQRDWQQVKRQREFISKYKLLHIILVLKL